MITNNVTRLLDSKKIKYAAFELPAEKLGAVESAKIMGISVDLVYKTIVLLKSNNKPLLCVVPGGTEVDLKAVAAFLNEKKVHLTTQQEAENLTGLLAGGISPLALINKGFTVLLDESAQLHDEIHISGGQRGLNIRMKPADLVALTHARWARIAVPVSEPLD